MAYLYLDYLEKRYVSTPCSCSAIFVFCAAIATIIAPYIFAYMAGGMWIK